MIRTTLVAACLLALAPPVMAASPTPDCSGLEKARADARTAATPLGYQVFDLDGESARQFEQGQDVPTGIQVDHLTVMVNPKTGRAAALLNDGPRCGFSSVLAVLPPHLPPIDSALDVLRLPR